MAKKTRRGVRTYKPYGLAVFLYALFSLAVVGCLAAFAVLPMFSFQQEGEPTIIFKGYEFIIFSVRRFFSSLAQPKFDTFVSYFASATPDNQLLIVIAKTHEYIELAIGGIMGVAMVWALILALLSAGFMIVGQSKHPKSLDVFAWLTFWFFAVGIGLSYMYFFFYQQIIGEGVVINLSLPLLGILGVMFVICIVIFITYKANFKDRVPFEGKKNKQQAATIEDAPVVAAQPQSAQIESAAPAQAEIVSEQAPQVAPAPAPAPQQAHKGPDVITVGDRAYAKNTELSSAHIPEGIVSLGSSAFANCVNLTSVSIPSTIQEIGFNCFFNTPKLVDIKYNGTVEHWKAIKRGSNWLTKSGTKTVQCLDGQINVNPRH